MRPRLQSGPLPSALRELRPLRGRYSDVLWRQPLITAVMPVIDRVDQLVRERRGLAHLPPYSLRVRSASMVGEFGGARWSNNAASLRQFLIDHADLKPDDHVLEIGCGAGRQALALSDYLNPGGYVGFDIDEASIEACRRTPQLRGFDFFVADVENEVYRPGGSTKAQQYRFPLDDGSFDLVFLASVFTHMLEEECANYSGEIMRVLAPGGRAAVSTYLKTEPVEGQAHGFHHRVGSAYVEHPEVPTKLVSYELETIQQWFGGAPIRPLLGRWRRDGRSQSTEWLDWVIVEA